MHVSEVIGSPDSRLRITLFGTFRVQLDGGREIDITGKRARAVLAILCLTPGVALERTQLCELLWHGRFQAQARASLRQTLLGLKKQLAPCQPDLFVITRESVAVNPACITSDLAELEATLAAHGNPRACELLLEIGAKALLARLDFGEAFEHWLSTRRAQVEQRLKHAVDAALSGLQQGGDEQEYRRLLEAWQLRAPDAAVSDDEARIRIGIVPFQTLGADDASAYITQGLFDELVTTLAQVPQLLVAGRGTPLVAARVDKPLVALARELRVAYLVLGSIQHQGDEVRVHVSLLDGDTGLERWSYGCRGTTADIFALQDDIARAVRHELASALNLDLTDPLPRRTTPSKSAYELYLQGRALTMRAIGDGVMARAVELLEAAVAMDPGFAEGWTALAEAHACTAVYTPCLDRLEQSARMAACARKAIELAPDQGHARAILGIHCWTENNPRGALDLAHEAYRLEPDNPEVVLRLGSFLLYIGRTREALPYIEAAIDLDPVNGRNVAMLCVARLNLGEIEEAMVAGQRMVDLGLPSMWLAVATAASGNHALAVEQYRQTRLLMNTVIFPPAGTKPLRGPALRAYWQMAAKGVCSGGPVHRAVYCALLDYLHTSLPDPCDTSIVAPAIWMGHSKLVFKTLGTQITPANMYCLMSLWADIEPIRKTRLHPDFLPFAKHIGLVAAWEKYGWPDLLPAPTPQPSNA
ncbi:MAG: hypothetical protein EA371_13930 [Gammaproteobacteria bacterium]|nr:MAG: hypothetical protein EA371_13930 [Gammaproteobacteria bacterium]